ncbi:MAG: Kazal-type serine protease inhibitor family protein [Planctomycetota bacterium]|jgi:hypothetical protein
MGTLFAQWQGVWRALVVAVPTVLLGALAGCQTSVRIDAGARDDDEPMTGNACLASGDECQSGTFCRFEDGTCADPGRRGVCVAIPDACAEIFQPVCGCDRQTYANECEAWVARVSIDHDGEC